MKLYYEIEVVVRKEFYIPVPHLTRQVPYRTLPLVLYAIVVGSEVLAPVLAVEIMQYLMLLSLVYSYLYSST